MALSWMTFRLVVSGRRISLIARSSMIWRVARMIIIWLLGWRVARIRWRLTSEIIIWLLRLWIFWIKTRVGRCIGNAVI